MLGGDDVDVGDVVEKSEDAVNDDDEMQQRC